MRDFFKSETTRKMQHKFEDYNPDIHETYKALTVKLPYAHYIAIGHKPFEIRKKKTHYRGPLVICSSQSPEIRGMQAGATLAVVELVDCIKVSELTPEQWEQARIYEDQEKYKDQWAWVLSNPKRLIELPVKGNLGIWNLVLDKGEYFEYPVHLNEIHDKMKSQEEVKREVRKIRLYGWAVIAIGSSFLAYVFYYIYSILL